MPHNHLQTLSHQRRPQPQVLRLLAVASDISLLLLVHHSFATSGMFLICAARVDTYFAGLVRSFLQTSFELAWYIACTVPLGSLPMGFLRCMGLDPLFPFAGRKDGGCWSVLGPFSRASRSNLKLTSLTSRSQPVRDTRTISQRRPRSWPKKRRKRRRKSLSRMAKNHSTL